jgi:hypothetical protein
MERIKIIIRYQYRYYFKKHKSFNVRNISIWQVKAYSIEERVNGAKLLEKWIKNNKSIADLTPLLNINEFSFENLTEKILNGNEDDILFIKLYSLFNSRKYTPNNLSAEIKPLDKIISLKAYCNFSKILLQKYEKTKDIQLLNTSLKINDFLLYCQISSRHNMYDGALANYFPSNLKNFQMELKTMEIFLENLTKELNYIKSL